MPMPITRSAIQRIADHRIRAAIAAGEMDGMPGAGKPIAGIDDAYDPLWWVKGWIARSEIATDLASRGASRP
jgi:hypothetical protein